MTKEQQTSGSEPLGIVLYTDGGCNPNPNGPCGWGMHAYTYAVSSKSDKPAKKIDLPTNEGYRNGNGLPKGVLQVTPITHYDGWGPVFGGNGGDCETSNNIAELNAAIRGLQLAQTVGAKEIKLIVDSEYVLKGANQWSKTWVKNNWIKSDGKPVGNAEDWKKLLAVIAEIQPTSSINWEWTKGHADNIGNNRADRNAGRGIQMYRQNDHHEILEETDSKTYWKPDARPSRFFGHQAWYFYTNLGEPQLSQDGRFVYYCGIHDKQSVKQGTDKRTADTRKNELWGKPSGEVRYSVLFTKEADPVLETLRAHQDALCKHKYCNAVAADLAAIFKQENYDTVYKYGTNYLMNPPLSNDIYTLGSPGEMLTFEASPPRRAFYAMENVALLERILESVLSPATAEFSVMVNDVTTLLYDVEEKKGKSTLKLKKAIAPGLKTIKLPAKYDTTGTEQTMELTLSVGLHTPDRNVLAALADQGAKVSVVTWRESDIAFRYAFVLDTDNDSSIYAAVHTNVVFLKS